MNINQIKAKSILTKTKLSADYVINPYVGCMHGCKYCYACFMKKFSGHMSEDWGSFVDVKENALELLPKKPNALYGKRVMFCSVTDAYQPCEANFQLTRKILEKLIPLNPHLEILTKSDLILRDMDLLKRFRSLKIIFSLGIIDENYSKQLEPLASSPKRRIEAMKKLHEEGISTLAFVSPIIPGISDWKESVLQTKDYAEEIWFENLNFYPAIQKDIFTFLKENQPDLVNKYKEIYSGKGEYWNDIKKEIQEFCKENQVNYKIFFH